MEQSPIDSTIGAECSQPQNTHPTNEIQTSFEELCDQQAAHFPTETQVVKQLTDGAKTEKALAFSYETVPVPSVVIQPANNYDIQQLLESSQAVEQVTNVDDENSHQVVPDVGQQNYSSINRRISVIGQDRLSTNSLSQVTTIQRRQGKSKPCHFSIQMEEEKPCEYDLDIPIGSTTFTYHGKTIPVNIKQFDKAPLLGQGNFGFVYAAVIKGPPDVPMAVKRIRPHEKDENGCLLKDTELTTMKKIGSEIQPYIVDYYCAIIDPVTGETCICMELMDTSVAKFYRAMHRLNKVPSDKLELLVRRITHNITSGLYFLETKEIVHRDVKPANMLISKNAVIKLCDFGICGNLTEAKSDCSAVRGTVAYLPPEPQQCAIQNDMWAMGISLVEIVNGKHPFPDCPQFETELKILEWEPTAPTTISDDMQQLILHLLKKKAQERPRSYIDILSKPLIRDVTITPSNDECDIVCRVIKRIRPIDSSNCCLQ